MITDKKGFIWIAHNLGLSRYDGISFTNFSNAEQAAISVTDLVEDNYGRIWCHNFNGQIFYVQNDKMYYLREYDFKSEYLFPRLVLYGDELIATSNKGLFICNTTTLKCRYIIDSGAIKDPLHFSFSAVCVIKNCVLAYAFNSWYKYVKGHGLERLQSAHLNFNPATRNQVKLEPRTNKDTAFLIDHAGGSLYGLTLIQNKVEVVFKKQISRAINTISVLDRKVWVNTTTGSYSLDGKDSLLNYNITTMTKDWEGNKWFGSLTNGLLVQYKPSVWKNITPPFLNGKDYIKCIKKAENSFIMCSQYGKILTATAPAKAKFTQIYSIPSHGGTPENIQAAFGDYFFIEMSKSLYAINTKKGVVTQLDSSISSKDISLSGNTAYMATSSQMMLADLKNWGLNNTVMPSDTLLIDDSLLFSNPSRKLRWLKKLRRCRAVLFDTITNSLLVSFTDGLQRLKNSRLTMVMYQGQPLYVSSIVKYHSKIYAGTFNNGLFVFDSSGIRHITDVTESPLDAIVKMKCCKNHIWILRQHDIEIIDANADIFIKNIYPFPEDSPDITDVEEDDSNIYIATINGLYTASLMEKTANFTANPSLLYLLVNGKDTLTKDYISLASTKNNLLFKLAIPVYNYAQQLHFKYRLYSPGKDSSESDWYYTQSGQRDLQFNALKPGNYILEINAIINNKTASGKPLTYSFSILQPWYNTWWFYLTIIIFLTACFFVLYRYRLYQVLKIERVRRKISSDLHDDIGSTLSSINIYSQLAKSATENSEYISSIQNNTVEIINNLDDLVWNINPKNDLLGNLLNRMRLFAEPLLLEKGMQCIFNIKVSNSNILVSPDARANIYLLFKEIVNNIAKHSGCTKCYIYFIQKGTSIRLIVKDNGKGFNLNSINRHRNGVNNMQQRANDLKGDFTIDSSPGNGTEIKLNCRLT